LPKGDEKMNNEKYEEIADNIINKNLKIQPKERVLIITDKLCEPFGRAFFDACQKLEIDGVMLMMPLTRTDGAEPSLSVSKAMDGADVIVALTKYTLTHGKATKRALEGGSRVLSIPNLTERIFLSRAIEGSPEMAKTTERISELLSGGMSLSLGTNRGTKITCDLGGWSRLGGADTGEIDKSGILANLPAGESIISPVEGTLNGKIIVDASISGGIGKLKDDVVYEIQNGRVMSIEGGAEASALRRVLENSDKNANNVAEIAFGINPFAEVIGNIIIDEKTVGTAHIGIGNSQMLGGSVYSNVHVDSVFYNPRVEVDGHLVMAEGKFFTGPAPWESLEFTGYDAEQSGFFMVKGDYEINNQNILFKRWKDVMGRTFSTRVGDEATSRSCASVMTTLKNKPADIEALSNLCRLERSIVKKAINMLIRYELVMKAS
jgi:leucyl aminopeptidase (aminopeptidase T)